jgi:hypothetical protein
VALVLLRQVCGHAYATKISQRGVMAGGCARSGRHAAKLFVRRSSGALGGWTVTSVALYLPVWDTASGSLSAPGQPNFLDFPYIMIALAPALAAQNPKRHALHHGTPAACTLACMPRWRAQRSIL